MYNVIIEDFKEALYLADVLVDRVVRATALSFITRMFVTGFETGSETNIDFFLMYLHYILGMKSVLLIKLFENLMKGTVMRCGVKTM